MLEEAALSFRTMTLLRRIRHQTSRRQLMREGFYFYVLAFVFIFLDLHFVGIKHYYPSFHREYLSVNAAALQAIFWALIGPVLWVLQEYVLRGRDWWESYCSLDWQIRGFVLAGAVVAGTATVVAWHWMLPLWGLVAAVALYLRSSRPKDSL
jgi:hypothetical protein